MITLLGSRDSVGNIVSSSKVFEAEGFSSMKSFTRVWDLVIEPSVVSSLPNLPKRVK